MKLQIETPTIRASKVEAASSSTDQESKLDIYFYPAKKQGNRYVPIGSSPVQLHLEVAEGKKENPVLDYYELNLPEIEAFSCVFALWENFNTRNLAEEKKMFQNIDKNNKEIPFHIQLSSASNDYDISFKVIVEEEA